MTNDQIIELAKQVGFHSASVLHIYGGNVDALCDPEIKELEAIQRFAELVRNEAIDKRVKVKLGSQYGNDLNGHWFYLQPADEEAQKALDNRSMKK